MLNYIQYKENMLADIGNKIKNKIGSVKSKFSDNNKKNLNLYKISYRKISDQKYEFLHDNKIISIIKLSGDYMGSPVFKLTIFFYNSEIPNTKNLSLKTKFENQSEQPYAKGSKNFFNTENALEFLIEFWSTKTNSGRLLNKNFKLKI